MNNHKAASILILVLVLLMGFGVTKLRSKAVAAREASDAVKIQAEQAEQQEKLSEIKLKTIDAKTATLRKVYTEWIPHFEAYRNPRIAEQKITDVVRDGDVFLLSQRFNEQEIEKGDLVSRALVADLVVEDDYTKTLNWLGKLEETIPSCRIKKCNIVRGDRGNNIKMDLKIEVPVLKISLASK
jgi:Sec-independent protein translocase protein TatA